MKFFLSALTLLMVTLASADKASLRAKIKAQLQMGGAYNCQYKCANLFGINSLWNDKNGNIDTNEMERTSISILNEYLGCAAGCDICGGGENTQCNVQCKNKNWFATVWWYNPHSGRIQYVEVDESLVQQQNDCLRACGNPETGGRAILSKDYTLCTERCYFGKDENIPVYALEKIVDPAMKNCKENAPCASIDVFQAGTSVLGTGTCYDTAGNILDVPLAKRYSPDMCGAGVKKNIIEPDKSCQFGCVQNLCQMGAGCQGKGAWSGETSHTHCQVITPQTQGEDKKLTIIPAIFEDPNKDLAGCCSQSRVCCSYKQSWAEEQPEQRKGVCTVASNKYNCGKGVPGFNIKDFGGDISNGAFPGDGCQTLWEEGGECQKAFADCPECLQTSHP